MKEEEKECENKAAESLYEATYEGYVDWKLSRKDPPMFEMMEYCDLVNLEKKVRAPQVRLSIGHALREIRKGIFEEIQWYLKSVAGTKHMPDEQSPECVVLPSGSTWIQKPTTSRTQVSSREETGLKQSHDEFQFPGVADTPPHTPGEDEHSSATTGEG